MSHTQLKTITITTQNLNLHLAVLKPTVNIFKYFVWQYTARFLKTKGSLRTQSKHDSPICFFVAVCLGILRQWFSHTIMFYVVNDNLSKLRICKVTRLWESRPRRMSLFLIYVINILFYLTSSTLKSRPFVMVKLIKMTAVRVNFDRSKMEDPFHGRRTSRI